MKHYLNMMKISSSLAGLHTVLSAARFDPELSTHDLVELFYEFDERFTALRKVSKKKVK